MRRVTAQLMTGRGFSRSHSSVIDNAMAPINPQAQDAASMHKAFIEAVLCNEDMAPGI